MGSIDQSAKDTARMTLGFSITAIFILAVLMTIIPGTTTPRFFAGIIKTENSDVDDSIFVKGAPVRGINHIEYGPDGLLYAASFLGNEITIFDLQTREIVDKLGLMQKVKSPTFVVLSPDGTLYWSSLFTGEVGRRGVQGEIRTQYVATGIQNLSYSNNGKLYGRCGMMGEKVYKLDPELIEPPHAINSMSGIDIVTGESESGAASALISINSDRQGRLYEPRASGQIERYDPHSQEKDIIAELPAGSGSLTLDYQDNVLVANVHDGAIYQIFPDGVWQILQSGGMIAPGGVAVISHPNGTESVYVADFWTLREYDSITGNPKYVEHHQRGPTHIIPPLTVFADGENLIISSWVSGMGVQVWNPATREVLESHSGFNMPICAIRFQDTLIVTELSSDLTEGRVIQLTKENQITLINTNDGLQVPAGIAAIDNKLWIADWATGTIWQIAPDDASLSKPVPVFTGLNHPEGISIDLDGTLLVVESGAGRLARIDLKTKQKTVVAENLALGAETFSEILPPTWIFNGVAVGKSGTIYVTGDVGNVVYRFTP
jgi:sugar lactone lactonase YvrE